MVYRFVCSLFVVIIMLCAMQGCSSVDSVTSNISKSMKDFVSFSEDSIDEKDFESVPFEMAINRSFESQLKGKKFKFTARYKGTVPNPGPYKGVKDFTNLKMCDLNKSEVCTDLIVMKTAYAQTVFTLSDNQPVDVYGSLLEVSGVEVGTTSELNFAANNMKAPYSYVRAYKVLPAGQHISSNSPAEEQSSSRPDTNELNVQTMDIATAQALLNRNGYNAGSVDGKIGPKTREAISKYQRDNGLSVTGSLNPETVSKLHASQ